MKIRKRNFKKNGDSFNFWPSFTDVMSSIVLVLFFLMLLAYIQNIVTGKNLEFARKEVTEQKNQLDAYSLQISQAQDVLRLLQDEVEKTKAEVKQGEEALKISQQQILEQTAIIAASNMELGNMRAKLQDIAVLRVDVLKKVKDSIEKEIGATNDKGEALVTIGENANIIINESVVFDIGKSAIKYQARELLDQFAVAFERILDDENIRNNIDAICIDGHADETGTTAFNTELSSERAYNVLNYLMESNPSLEKKYGSYFAATGYSEFRPINTENTEAARQQNRRIEISINIKDSNIQKIIDDYLQKSDQVLAP